MATGINAIATEQEAKNKLFNTTTTVTNNKGCTKAKVIELGH